MLSDDHLTPEDEAAIAILSAVRAGIAEIEAGRVQDAEEFFDELARKYES